VKESQLKIPETHVNQGWKKGDGDMMDSFAML